MYVKFCTSYVWTTLNIQALNKWLLRYDYRSHYAEITDTDIPHNYPNICLVLMYILC